ncbi:MAG TPA: transcriptional regulator [Allosphingosinicella sp.]|jgi:DNA-binding winged helix-turn-helix (wHTH) protein
MASGGYLFEDFHLDPADRQLRRGGAPVEINARYLDALALLVREQGRLVSKDRFMEEVWRGIPVTDEALTQCIKTLRRQLGDNASNPRFIETVPKHGYRFIASVEAADDAAAPSAPVAPLPPAEPASAPAGRYTWQDFLMLGGAGTVGGGTAGALVGLLYGFGGASQPLEPGMGAVSVLLVLVCVGILAGLIAGAGVAFGIAASGFAGDRRPWSILGGAAGGLIVGAFAKLLGLDAFTLLVGRSPGDITGAPEGALLGAFVGLAAWLAARSARPLPHRLAISGALGAVGGLLIPLLGGRTMGGSLELLAQGFPASRLRLDQLGAMFGESGFGPISQAASGAVEGALFGAGLVGAIMAARRRPQFDANASG